MSDAIAIARAKVDQAFAGFIGNAEACYSIKRSLIVALASAPEGKLPSMAKTFLLSGPPSVGKTELARRVTSVLGVPFVRLDGRAVKTRDVLFEMIDEALMASNLLATRNGQRAGVPMLDYPPFAVFVDEIHLTAQHTQEALLTLLEADDRTMLLNGSKGRRIAVVGKAAWIFATTRPAELDRAFRSRCAEIPLRRYSLPEVMAMVRARFPDIPDEQVETIASCSRMVPRQAFAMAGEVVEEMMLAEDGDVRACVKRVMHGRSIRWANGVTADDVRYLDVLMRERRPMGEGAIQAALYDVDPGRIEDDLEPFLLWKEYIAITGKGRVITLRGQEFVKDAHEAER